GIFLDIVPDTRIISAGTMADHDARMTATLAPSSSTRRAAAHGWCSPTSRHSSARRPRPTAATAGERYSTAWRRTWSARSTRRSTDHVESRTARRGRGADRRQRPRPPRSHAMTDPGTEIAALVDARRVHEHMSDPMDPDSGMTRIGLEP